MLSAWEDCTLNRYDLSIPGPRMRHTEQRCYNKPTGTGAIIKCFLLFSMEIVGLFVMQ